MKFKNDAQRKAVHANKGKRKSTIHASDIHNTKIKAKPSFVVRNNELAKYLKPDDYYQPKNNSKKEIRNAILKNFRHMTHHESLVRSYPDNEPMEKNIMFGVALHRGKKFSISGDIPVLAMHYQDINNHKAFLDTSRYGGKNWRIVVDGNIIHKTDDMDEAFDYYERLKDHPDNGNKYRIDPRTGKEIKPTYVIR